MDRDYPARAGFSVVNQILDEFEQRAGSSWRGATADTSDALPVLEPALEKYQVRGGGRMKEKLCFSCLMVVFVWVGERV